MRIPHTRFAFRWMMIAVAVAAVLLAVEKSRWIEYRPRHPDMRQIRADINLPGRIETASVGQPIWRRASWEEKWAEVLVFSPDGTTLVTLGHDGARLRDAATGRVRVNLATRRDLFLGPAFSPDGRLLFAKVSSERFKHIGVSDLKVWDVARGETRSTFPYISEGGNPDHFALSTDGRMLAFLDNCERLPMQVKTSKMSLSGHEMQAPYNASPGLPRVKLWNIPRSEEMAIVDGGSPLVFSPDGTTLATGSRDWRVPVAKVWDTATGKLRAELVGKTQWVKPMGFSRDGKLLAIGGDGDQTLWEVASGKKWELSTKLTGTQSPVFSADGALLFLNGLPSGYPVYDTNQDFPCYDVSSLPPRRLELGAGLLVDVTSMGPPRKALLNNMVVSLSLMRYAVIGETDKQGMRAIRRDRAHRRQVLPGRSLACRLDRPEHAGFPRSGLTISPSTPVVRPGDRRHRGHDSDAGGDL